MRISLTISYADPNNLLIFLENHDTGRFNEIYKTISKIPIRNDHYGNLRGIPNYITALKLEWLETIKKRQCRYSSRFPRGWKDDSNNAFSAGGRTTRASKYFDFSKKF